MACLNINSLVSHIDDLRVVMSQFKDIDILAINETKLDATIKDGEVYLTGYDVVRKDRESNGRNGGGVCIYVRSNINFQLRADLSPNNLECLTVEISKPRSKPFLVSTWYRPPQSSPGLFSTFERIIDKIDDENLELYLLGDLNCNLLSEVVSNNSSHLLYKYHRYLWSYSTYYRTDSSHTIFKYPDRFMPNENCGSPNAQEFQ